MTGIYKAFMDSERGQKKLDLVRKSLQKDGIDFMEMTGDFDVRVYDEPHNLKVNTWHLEKRNCALICASGTAQKQKPRKPRRNPIYDPFTGPPPPYEWTAEDLAFHQETERMAKL